MHNAPLFRAIPSTRRASSVTTLVALALACGMAAAPAVAADSAKPAQKNWMREYVQLRVAERTLDAAPAGIKDADVDRIVSPMIVGGSVADASDNPFQVALLTKNITSNFDAQFCGGTLYKANYVITAAHCSDFVTAGQVQVLTGTLNLDGTGVRRNVTRITIHPNWEPGTYNNDVAVWQLSTPATNSPLASLATSDGAVGSTLLATGWGALVQDGSFPVELRKVSLPLVSRTNCNDANSYNGRITGAMLCAGRDSGGIDTCQGDSGGPLARGSVLTGIVSWGDSCASPNLFGVYTRVSSPTIRNFIIGVAGPK